MLWAVLEGEIRCWPCFSILLIYTLCVWSIRTSKTFHVVYNYRLWTEEAASVEVAERLVYNISQGRKIFRFLKFLEQFRKIYDYYKFKQRKPLLIKVLSYSRYVCAFFFYLNENIVWFANMGLIDKTILSVKWKRFRDFYGLWKNIAEVTKHFLLWVRNWKKL